MANALIRRTARGSEVQRSYQYEHPGFTELWRMAMAGEPITDSNIIQKAKLCIADATRSINDSDIEVIDYILSGMIFPPPGYGMDKESWLEQIKQNLSRYPALVAKWGLLHAGDASARHIHTVANMPDGTRRHYVLDVNAHCEKLMQEFVQPVIDYIDGEEQRLQQALLLEERRKVEAAREQKQQEEDDRERAKQAEIRRRNDAIQKEYDAKERAERLEREAKDEAERDAVILPLLEKAGIPIDKYRIAREVAYDLNIKFDDDVMKALPIQAPWLAHVIKYLCHIRQRNAYEAPNAVYNYHRLKLGVYLYEVDDPRLLEQKIRALELFWKPVDGVEADNRYRDRTTAPPEPKMGPARRLLAQRPLRYPLV